MDINIQLINSVFLENCPLGVLLNTQVICLEKYNSYQLEVSMMPTTISMS